MQKQLQFFSVASDGRVTLWTLEKSELTHQVDGWLSQQMQGLVQHTDTPVEAAEAQVMGSAHQCSRCSYVGTAAAGTLWGMPVDVGEGLTPQSGRS